MQAFKRHCLDQDFRRWLTHAHWDTRQRYPFEDIRTSKFIPNIYRRAAAFRDEALATLDKLCQEHRTADNAAAVYDVAANHRALIPFVRTMIDAARAGGVRLP